MLWCCLYEYYLLFFYFFSQFPLQKLVLTNGLVWGAKPLLAPCSTSAFRRLTLHTALQSTKYLWFAKCSPYMHNVHHICTMFTKYAKWSQCLKFAQFEMCKWSQCSQNAKYEPAVWIDLMTSLCGHSLIFSVSHKTQYQVTQMLNKNWPVFSFCTSEQL